ncbi:hypothetical protein [Kitasatospora purpeofusca]|uniref:hypothetical protein n=1 Tax=Kitasatospora purpeofusca TaxID=67352 RepID=UPI0035E2408E
MSIQAGTTTRAGIQETYEIQPGLLQQWIADPDFPDAVGSERAPEQSRGAAQLLYDAAAVDAYVEAHDRLQWLQAHHGTDAVEQELLAKLPRGNPADLLNRKEFGVVFGNFTRGEPLGDSTMRSYVARGQVPEPDRQPDDGKEPQVYEPHWFRRTINTFLLNRPGRGMRGQGRKRTESEPGNPELIGVLPEGNPDDYLTLTEAGVIVGNFARGKPYPRNTMNNLKTGGRITPDRTPGDGRHPDVKEPLYLRSTVNALAEAQRKIARG